MLQVLMRSNNLFPPNNQVDAPNQVVEPSHKGRKSPIDTYKEEHLSEVFVCYVVMCVNQLRTARALFPLLGGFFLWFVYTPKKP